jgi:hypothetical protein
MKITEEMIRNSENVDEEPKTNRASEDGRSDGDSLAEAIKAQQNASKRTEREKLKSMSGKDRIWYIITYYKFHIIAAVAAIIILYTVGLSAYRMSFKTAFHCLYINSRSEEETNMKPLEQDFAAWAGLGKKDKIYVENAYISYGEEATEYSIATLEKISALVLGEDLDAMVCDKENLDHFAESGGFLDLEEALPEEFTELHMNRFYYTEGPDGELHAYAVDLEGLPFIKDSNLAQEFPLYGIVSNSQRVDTAIAVLEYMFEYK